MSWSGTTLGVPYCGSCWSWHWGACNQWTWSVPMACGSTFHDFMPFNRKRLFCRKCGVFKEVPPR